MSGAAGSVVDVDEAAKIGKVVVLVAAAGVLVLSLMGGTEVGDSFVGDDVPPEVQADATSATTRSRTPRVPSRIIYGTMTDEGRLRGCR